MSVNERAVAAAAGAESSPADEPESDMEFHAELADAEIAARAYSHWEQRGFAGGSPDEDWFRAEEELRAARHKKPTRA